MLDVLIGAGAGGLISLASALAVDLTRSRRDREHRWDRDQLEAAIAVIAAGREYIDRQYFCGRAEYQRGGSPAHEAKLQNAVSDARQATTRWNVAIATAQLLLPGWSPELFENLDRHAEGLRLLAQHGFESGSPEWAEPVVRFRGGLGTFASAASGVFNIGSVWAAAEGRGNQDHP